MDGSDDEQVPEQVEFNAKSDMRNVVLKKEMKFPNAKVFRAALKEYAIKNLLTSNSNLMRGPRYQFTARMGVGGDVMHLK